MKDIKIRITDKGYTISVLDHAATLGYKINEDTLNCLLSASYLMLDPNQNIKWCNPIRFNNAELYEEYTDVEFLNYKGED
jgi:hypothetical protein